MTAQWMSLLANANTADRESERKFIVDAPLAHGHVAMFSQTPRWGRADGAMVARAYGRSSDVSRLVARIDRLDAIVSRVAGLPRAPTMLHAALYSGDEYAHSPTDGPRYISLNVSVPRVRDILRGTMRGDAASVAVLVDLMLHEKAHLGRERRAGHDDVFYAEKGRLRSALLGTLKNDRRRDPFRTRFALGWLPEASDMAMKFPGLVRRSEAEMAT